jgi:hypothetical protein
MVKKHSSKKNKRDLYKKETKHGHSRPHKVGDYAYWFELTNTRLRIRSTGIQDSKKAVMKVLNEDNEGSHFVRDGEDIVWEKTPMGLRKVGKIVKRWIGYNDT